MSDLSAFTSGVPSQGFGAWNSTLPIIPPINTPIVAQGLYEDIPQIQEKTRIVNGSQSLKPVIDGEISINRSYSRVEDIPKEEFFNVNQMFVFGPGHVMIHKSREHNKYFEKNPSKAWDVWVEYRGGGMDRVYGPPFAHSVLDGGKSGGSVSVGKSNGKGVSFAPTVSRSTGFSIPILLSVSFSFSVSFTLTVGYEISFDASCNVPKNTKGGLFAFDSSSKFSYQQREWRLKTNYRKTPKYVKGKWIKQHSDSRNFEEPIFVCSLDKDYIDTILARMQDIRASDDYSEFLPAPSRLFGDNQSKETGVPDLSNFL